LLEPSVKERIVDCLAIGEQDDAQKIGRPFPVPAPSGECAHPPGHVPGLAK
jgi:hypothetical protein